MSSMGSLGAPTAEAISIGRNLARNAAEKPNAPALTGSGKTLIYGELHKRTNRMARGLLARGVKLGDFVTISMPNSHGFIEAEFALWKIGATPQPVSYRLPPGELKAIIELANSPLVIGDNKAMDVGRPIVSPEELLAASADDSDLPDAITPHWKAPTSGGSTCCSL